jgi:hypothetical protein
MTTNNTDEEIQRVCSILESISKVYPSDSDEALAIRDAANAYILVQHHEALKKAYQKLLLALGGQLSDEMEAKLRSIGIEPDDLDDDNNAKIGIIPGAI